MSLKDVWTDKIDGIDDVLADDINSIAHEAIRQDEKIENILLYKADKATTLLGYGITDAYTKTDIDSKIGDIETALDSIIAIQNSLIGGDSV